LHRKRKPRKNSTKKWFPKEPAEASSSQPELGDSGQHQLVSTDVPKEIVGTTPQRRVRCAVKKKITPKKKICF
jgi:hypothetical protein